MLLTDADQLREALAIALRERDEARAEVERLRQYCEVLKRVGDADLQMIAIQQRAACVRHVERKHGSGEKPSETARKTPLVTEGKT